MGLVKEMFMKQAEDAFMKAGMFGLENLMANREERYREEEAEAMFSYQTETVEFDKGDYRTTVKIRFNSKGYPVIHSVEATLIEDNSQQNTEINLQDLIDKAVAEKDFRAALIFQTQLDDLKKPA